MNDEHLWGFSPWKYSELENMRIESIHSDCRFDGIGTLRVRERPSGEQRIEIIRDHSSHRGVLQEIICVPTAAYASIQRHPDPQKADFLLVK